MFAGAFEPGAAGRIRSRGALASTRCGAAEEARVFDDEPGDAEGLTDAVEGAFGALGIERVHLVGHSMGGALVGLAALLVGVLLLYLGKRWLDPESLVPRRSLSSLRQDDAWIGERR